MKILYFGPAACDYQADALMHGLRTCHGTSLIDFPRMDRMYSDYPDLSSLYGRGFTIWGLLPNHEIDRTRIPERIIEKEFDLIIYGSICRAVPYLQLVTYVYPSERILFVDGEDTPTTLPDVAQHGILFKRELAQPHPGVHPIHFAIPTSKIGTLKHLPKNKVRAAIDPRDRSTYIYTTEESYYADYAQSLFAFTMKKAGWDTMRTLEILANKCLPLYLDLDKCPSTTCINLPKPELLEVLTYMDRDASFWDSTEGHSLWTSLWRRIHLRFAAYSTTEALARYVLEIQQREATA
jgi:hypothetical protein